MKKKIFLGSAVLLGIFFIFSTAYPWNYATHAYIVDKIGKKLPLSNANEMYGIMAPDLFNLEFSLMDDMKLWSYTHGIPGKENFMKVWKKARLGLQRSLAFGYVAHNEVWGADYTAHFRSQLPLASDPTYGPQPPGYVIILAIELDKILAAQGVWGMLGLPLTLEDRLMFCHNIVEYAGDILIKRADPLIGQKIINACILRSPEFPSLLKNAFPPEYGSLIGQAEKAFRNQTALYGAILLMPEKTALNILSDQLAGLAIDYLEFLFDAPPGSFDYIKPQLATLAQAAMGIGIELCAGYHYLDEVQLTIGYVETQLAAHHVFYLFW